MKYTSEYINSLSFTDYLELMAKELNENGFRETDGTPYEVYDYLPKNALMLDAFEDDKALGFLRSQGLIENGRCPFCGAPMSVYKYYWSDRRNPSKKVYVCYGCNKSNGRGDGHSMDGCPSGAPRNTSASTSNNSGCMVALLMLPFLLVKTILHF